MNTPEIEIGQVYRHYKGNHYEVIAIGRHSETPEELIGYRRREDGKVYFRPRAMFFNSIEHEGVKTTRFVLVESPSKLSDILIQAYGWYGTIAIIGAFAANSIGWMLATDLVYQVLNATGAFGIALAAFYRKSYQPAVLNIVWGIIAIMAITNILF